MNDGWMDGWMDGREWNTFCNRHGEQVQDERVTEGEKGNGTPSEERKKKKRGRRERGEEGKRERGERN